MPDSLTIAKHFHDQISANTAHPTYLVNGLDDLRALLPSLKEYLAQKNHEAFLCVLCFDQALTIHLKCDENHVLRTHINSVQKTEKPSGFTQSVEKLILSVLNPAAKIQISHWHSESLDNSFLAIDTLKKISGLQENPFIEFPSEEVAEENKFGMRMCYQGLTDEALVLQPFEKPIFEFDTAYLDSSVKIFCKKSEQLFYNLKKIKSDNLTIEVDNQNNTISFKANKFQDLKKEFDFLTLVWNQSIYANS